MKLTSRYITDRHLPDKAIDALDEVGSRVHLTNINVPKEIIDNRFDTLKTTQTDISERKLKRFVGTEQIILIEKISKKNNKIYSGKINSGQITHIGKENLKLGDLVKVKIIDSTPFFLKAELV